MLYVLIAIENPQDARLNLNANDGEILTDTPWILAMELKSLIRRTYSEVYAKGDGTGDRREVYIANSRCMYVQRNGRKE